MEQVMRTVRALNEAGFTGRSLRLTLTCLREGSTAVVMNCWPLCSLDYLYLHVQPVLRLLDCQTLKITKNPMYSTCETETGPFGEIICLSLALDSGLWTAALQFASTISEGLLLPT